MPPLSVWSCAPGGLLSMGTWRGTAAEDTGVRAPAADAQTGLLSHQSAHLLRLTQEVLRLVPACDACAAVKLAWRPAAARPSPGCLRRPIGPCVQLRCILRHLEMLDFANTFIGALHLSCCDVSEPNAMCLCHRCGDPARPVECGRHNIMASSITLAPAVCQCRSDLMAKCS